MNTDTKKLVVVWTATYETEVDVPINVQPEDAEARNAAFDVSIDVNGSEYKDMSFLIEDIYEKNR